MYFAAETNAPGRSRLRVSAAKSSGRSCTSRLVDGVGLGLMDGAVAVGPQRQRRQPDGLHAGAELLQHADRLLDRPHLIGIGFGVLFVEMLDDADAQALQPGLQILQAVRRRALRGGRIVRVVAGDGVEQDRVVLDRARHRPDVVERIGQREHAGERLTAP